MKVTISIFCLLTGYLVTAGEITPLWVEGRIPDFQAHQKASITEQEKAAGYRKEDHTMPYLEWFAADSSAKTNAAFLLISGGGYSSCCDGFRLAKCVKKLTGMGITCASLTYRTPRPKGLPIYQTAWEDGQRAVRVMRAQAAARGYDPEKIGVLGMSAGAHLAMLLTTSALTPAYVPTDELDALPCHVNISIPVYTAYALTDGLTGPNTRYGDAPDVRLDTCFQFDAKTCPTCLFHGGEDIYSPNGSTMLYREFRARKIPAEVHLYADRIHGFGGTKPCENWLDRAEEFLRQMGFAGILPPAEKVLEREWGADPASTERVTLWPEGKTPDATTNCTYAPYLTWYLPKERKTGAIQVIFPGGAYHHCQLPKEANIAARYFNAKGMAAVTVCYRTPSPEPGEGELARCARPFQDAQRAIRLVRDGAAARGLDPARIGVMGFSAGGHLALLCATSSRRQAYRKIDAIDDASCRVVWAVPIYPGYVLPGRNGKPGNRDENDINEDFNFDLDTPPMCFVHGDADVVPAMGSVKVWEKLRKMGIQCDLHTLATRGHCFYFEAAPGTASHNWLDRVWDFLDHKGLNK